MARHLESVQWAMRSVTPMVKRDAIGEPLPVDRDPITLVELRQAIKALRTGKAAGPDDVPAEFWKVVVTEGSAATEWILKFCNPIWTKKEIPAQWRVARVSMLYKKGDATVCDNYRPKSLLTIGYKVLAVLLLNRLKAAGAEERVWWTQCGFRSQSGTSDAIFIARRRIEEAWATKEGSAILLALDWSKAFDSIALGALWGALRRFGVPEHMLMIIGNIYKGCHYFVRDAARLQRP